MRTKIMVIAVLVMLMLTTGTALAGKPLHTVSGGGSTYFEGFGTERYAFNAQVDSEGAVKGQGEFTFIIPEGKFHAEMNCLAVDGNIAWLGMVITRTDNPAELPVGLDWTWQLQDNGEGVNAPPDLQSYFFPTADLAAYGFPVDDCNDMPDLFSYGTFEWDTGNIQVDQSN